MEQFCAVKVNSLIPMILALSTSGFTMLFTTSLTTKLLFYFCRPPQIKKKKAVWLHETSSQLQCEKKVWWLTFNDPLGSGSRDSGAKSFRLKYLKT